jgi:hypothetical protein
MNFDRLPGLEQLHCMALERCLVSTHLIELRHGLMPDTHGKCPSSSGEAESAPFKPAVDSHSLKTAFG